MATSPSLLLDVFVDDNLGIVELTKIHLNSPLTQDMDPSHPTSFSGGNEKCGTASKSTFSICDCCVAFQQELILRLDKKRVRKRMHKE